ASGSPPLLDEKIWERSLFKDAIEELDPKNAQDWVKKALEAQKQGINAPTLPGFFPIAVSGRLIYRSYTNVVSVALKDIKDKDGKVVVKAGEMEWCSNVPSGCLGLILQHKDMYVSTIQWLSNGYNLHTSYLPMVFENSQVGVLTSDNNNVYFVD